MSHTINKILQCLQDFLNYHPEIDVFECKQEAKTFADIFQLITDEDERRRYNLTLLSICVSRYYPLPENFIDRVNAFDSNTLKEMVKTAYSSSFNERNRVLSLLLSEAEMAWTTVGYALRVSGYTVSPFILSTEQVPDYSTSSLHRVMTRLAKTNEERAAAKEMFIAAFREAWAFRLVFIPTEILKGDLLLVASPSNDTQSYKHEIICPITSRKIEISYPSCYRFSTQGCERLASFIAADLAMSHILWKWLRVVTCQHYETIISSLSHDQSSSLYKLKHCIDIFIYPFHPILKDSIGGILVCKYLHYIQQGREFLNIYHTDKVNIACLLAECLEGNGQLNAPLFAEKFSIYLRYCPHLQTLTF